MKNALVFVDTNVFLYAHDHNAGTKQTLAARLLEALWDSQRGRLSTQVLLESYAVLLKKFGLSTDDVAAVGKPYKVWCTVDTTPALVEQGLALMKRHQLPFFDSLIVAAASASGSKLLLSEDFNPGQIYDGIQAINPFAVGFSLSSLHLA